jgi:prepilin-type N-terminal cleavage/methylation domain-containing protein
MNTEIKDRGAALKNHNGFTLIEMLIVIIVLGILAMIIIPQITVSTEDAKINTIKTNLGAMRNAIELYYHQHSETYPGANSNLGVASANATEAATAFLEQLTQYTEIDGKVFDTKSATAKYGPYIKGGKLPINSFDPDEDRDVTCNIVIAAITTRTADGASAWLFYTKTGVLIANDNLSDHATY